MTVAGRTGKPDHVTAWGDCPAGVEKGTFYNAERCEGALLSLNRWRGPLTLSTGAGVGYEA
ncbi:hypothetical protein GCM10028775_10670 [Catellatospora paridis]